MIFHIHTRQYSSILQICKCQECIWHIMTNSENVRIHWSVYYLSAYARPMFSSILRELTCICSSGLIYVYQLKLLTIIFPRRNFNFITLFRKLCWQDFVGLDFVPPGHVTDNYYNAFHWSLNFKLLDNI